MVKWGEQRRREEKSNKDVNRQVINKEKHTASDNHKKRIQIAYKGFSLNLIPSSDNKSF